MRPGGPTRKPEISLTGLLFGVFLVASLVFLYRLFHNPDQSYTPVEVRDAGPFQPREEEEAERKSAPDAKPVSSLEFIPKRQVPLSPPQEETTQLPAAEPAPPPAVTAPPPAASPPPRRTARPVAKPQFTPMPESKTASGTSSAAFLAAPKASADGKPSAETKPSAASPSAQSKQSPAAKPRGRDMQAVIR